MMRRLLFPYLVWLFVVQCLDLSGQQRDCMFGPAETSVQTMSFNTNYSEYAPVFVENGILFSSNRLHSIGVIKVTALDSSTPDNLYMFQGQTSTVTYVRSLNTRDQEGTGCYDFNSRTLYFAATVKVQEQSVLGIFSSVLSEAGSWGPINPVLIPTSPHSYFHPCILNDGQTLVIASDRLDGFGGVDLYVSSRHHEAWSEPKNLGASVNTYGDDAYPSYCAPGYFFFSSRGRMGKGGFDIYCGKWKEGVVSGIVPAGDSINSAADDFGLIFDSSERMGYFTSNRTAANSDDVFRFDVDWPEFQNCTPFVEPQYCYTFSEENSMNGDDVDLFYYQWNFGDGTTANSLEADHCFAGPGTYNVELIMRDKRDTNFFMTQVAYEHEIEAKPGLRINMPDIIYEGDTVVITSNNSFLESQTIRQYYWDYGDLFLIPGATTSFIAQDTGRFTIKLGVRTTRDELDGNDSTLTQQLSCTERQFQVLPRWQKFAVRTPHADTNSFVLFQSLESPVFDLSAIGHPEYTVFVGSASDSVSSIQDSSLAHLRIFRDGDVFRYVYGSADSIHNIYPSYTRLRALGLDSVFVVVLSEDSLVGHQISMVRDFKFTPITAGLLKDTSKVIRQPLALNTSDTSLVFFDFDKNSLTKGGQHIIDSLVADSDKNMDYRYELIGLTDNAGDLDYNMELSSRRSAAVESRLLRNGVRGNNISNRYFGENPPTEFTQLLSAAGNTRCVIIIRYAKPISK